MRKFFADQRIALMYIITIIFLIVGTTYALQSEAISLGLTTAIVGIDETAYGSTTFDSSNLEFEPIIDTEVESSTDNVVKIDFTVGGSENNNNDNIIYDIALVDLEANCDLLSPYIKWKLVKDGEVKGTANEIVSETILKKFLIDFEFIDKENQNRDYQVNDEEFKKMMESEEKNIFIIYTFEGSHYDFRKRILKLSNKYNFNYGLIYSGVGTGARTSRTVREILGDKYKVPMVIITQNGSIIDYINSIKEQDLVEFLKKNEIINK